MLSKNQIKRIQSLARKKGRREEGCFIAEGNKLVEDTLSAFECDLLLATPSWIVSHAHESLPKIQEVDEQEMSKVFSARYAARCLGCISHTRISFKYRYSEKGVGVGFGYGARSR